MSLAGVTARRASSTTCTTDRAECRTTTRTRWRRRWSRRPRTPASGSRCSTPCYLAGGLAAGGTSRSTTVQARFSDGAVEAWRAPGSLERLRRRAGPRSCRSPRCTRCAPCRPRRSPLSPRRATVADRCTSTCPSSRPRTRRASPCTAVTPDAAARRPRAARARDHRRARDPPHRGRRRPPRRDRARGSAPARPPSATWPTASARSPRCAAAGSPLSLGTDQHAVTDLLEEARGSSCTSGCRPGDARPSVRRSCWTRSGTNGFGALGAEEGGWIAGGGRRPRRGPAGLAPHRRRRPRPGRPRRHRGRRAHRRGGRRWRWCATGSTCSATSARCSPRRSSRSGPTCDRHRAPPGGHCTGRARPTTSARRSARVDDQHPVTGIGELVTNDGTDAGPARDRSRDAAARRRGRA